LKTLKISVILAAAFSLALAGLPSRSPAEGGGSVTLLYTADFSGQVMPRKGCGGRPSGGLARNAGKVGEFRKTGENIVLLDCGDFVSEQGYDRELTARVFLKGMNGMMYDAVVLGPQDLALGPGRLKNLLEDAIFPVVTSNVVNGGTGEPFEKGHAVFERGGVRIGVVGVVPDGEVKRTAPFFREGGMFRVLPMEEAARKAVGEIRNRVDVLVLVSQGSYAETCGIVEKVPGIDLAVYAGEGGPIPGRPLPSTPVLQSPHRGGALGFAKIAFRDGKAVLKEHRLISLSCKGGDIPEDPVIAALIGPDFNEKLAGLRLKYSTEGDEQALKEAKELWKLSPKAFLEQERNKQGGKKAPSPADNPFLQMHP
jgi:2',3'-cyclic-nucleotide 2'-phosphodiesterase (5'-nucleotidase family)